MVKTNIGGYIKTVVAMPNTALTAAGTGDNTAVTGAVIDLMGYSSLSLVLPWVTTLTADKTLSLTVTYTTSDDDSTYGSAVTLQAAVVVKTGAVTAGTGNLKLNLNVDSLPRYIKFAVTPDLSHSGTDTAIVGALAILGGADALPAA